MTHLTTGIVFTNPKNTFQDGKNALQVWQKEADWRRTKATEEALPPPSPVSYALFLAAFFWTPLKGGQYAFSGAPEQRSNFMSRVPQNQRE